jgi:hypothetical protein
MTIGYVFDLFSKLTNIINILSAVSGTCHSTQITNNARYDYLWNIISGKWGKGTVVHPWIG